MRGSRGAGILRSLWAHTREESLGNASVGSFLLSENATQLRRCLRTCPEGRFFPLTSPTSSPSSRCSPSILPLRSLSTTGSTPPPPSVDTRAAASSAGAAAAAAAAASAGKAQAQGEGAKPEGAASTEDFFSGHEEGAGASSEAGGHGASSGPRSFFWDAARLAFSTGFLVTAGALGYVTYAYDTNTVKGWVEEKKEAFKASHPDSAQLTDHSQGSAWMKPQLWPALVENALLDLGETYVELRQDAEERLHSFTSPTSDRLLPDLLPNERGTYTLVLDLEGTLVQSEWRRDRGWRTFKRPGADAFLERMSQFYELVLFSDQLNMTAEPILARLDPNNCIRFRLFRDATQYTKGTYVRDLSKLNRDTRHVFYVTANPKSVVQKENMILLPEWKPDSADDTALLDLLPFLEFVSRQRPPDTRAVLASYEGQDIPTVFKQRAKEYQRQVQERKQGSFFRFR